jgi:exonuclease, DNA polymerase III, epsilon subunit family
MYAIVDIETTGGYAAAGGITEIAVVLFDGEKVTHRFHSLLNPVYTIPKYVEALTGITNEMVEGERLFGVIAEELYELIRDKIFVAHNVNFDYSFIKYNLQQSGYNLDCKKLCTVRMGRQILPGFRSYSLGNFCRELGITIEQRHRAMGDADATARLFSHLLKCDTNGHIQTMLKSKSKEQNIPANLPVERIKELPATPGIYYFHDEKGKVIYVGKAKNISKRVNSHFSNNKPTRQKQEFLRKIYNITYQLCGTELMAFILESLEIKKLWPRQNKSQKRFEQSYGLYAFEDRSGYLRLAIEKKSKNLQPLYTFNMLMEGHNLLRKLSHQFQLCPRLCFLQADAIPCVGLEDGRCLGACEKKESPGLYNLRVGECIDFLQRELPTFALFDNGIQYNEQSCILIEKGRFYGMGYLPNDISTNSIEDLKSYITPYAENDYIRGLVYQHATKFPAKKIELAN